MDAYMIILRLIHFFAGISWVGTSIFMVFFISPTVTQLGPDGGKFMQGLLRLTPFSMFLPIVAALTVISGALMYYEVSDGFNADWMKLDRSIVLSIGAVVGVLAFLHGGATLGRASNKMRGLAIQIAAQGGPPSEEQMATITQTTAYLNMHSKITVVLVVITVAGMASARYF